jgi:WD40 repeat protein
MGAKSKPRESLFGRRITAIAFSPGGRRALTGDSAGGLALWDLDPGEEIRSWQACPEGTWRAVEDVAFLPDGNRAVALGGYHQLAGWDVRTGKALWTANTGDHGIPAMAISADGKLALTADAERDAHVAILRLWDPETGTLKREWKPVNPRRVCKLFLKPGGQEACGAEMFCGRVFVWDVTNGKTIREFNGNTETAVASFTSDGRYMLGRHQETADVERNRTGGEFITLWSLGDGGAVWSRTASFPWETASSVAVSPDGSLGLASREKNKIEVLDIGTGRTLRLMEGPEGCNHVLAFSPDGKRALSGGGSGKVRTSYGGGPPPEDRTLILWNVATGKAIRTLKLSPQTEMEQIEAAGGKAFPR